MNKFLRKNAEWLVLGLVILVFAGIRYRLADIPLERDEGEYAYMGQVSVEQLLPHVSIFAYAAIISVFGQTARGIHLGLAIVKTLVEAQGGAVSVRSEIGVGSTFSVELPRHASPPLGVLS